MTNDELYLEALRHLRYPNRAPSTAHVQLLEMILPRWRPGRTPKEFRCPKCGGGNYRSHLKCWGEGEWDRTCMGCGFTFPQYADHLFWVPVPAPEYGS